MPGRRKPMIWVYDKDGSATRQQSANDTAVMNDLYTIYHPKCWGCATSLSGASVCQIRISRQADHGTIEWTWYKARSERTFCGFWIAHILISPRAENYRCNQTDLCKFQYYQHGELGERSRATFEGIWMVLIEYAIKFNHKRNCEILPRTLNDDLRSRLMTHSH